VRVLSDVLQNEASEKTPGKTHDSKDTDTDDVGESVELVPQSTTIGEILVTATTSTTPLIVGLTVGLTIIGFAIITIIMLNYQSKGVEFEPLQSRNLASAFLLLHLHP